VTACDKTGKFYALWLAATYFNRTGETMMPITMARIGEENAVKKIGGKDETRQFLANLGFTPGSRVTVVAAISGNVIVSVKESRIAVIKEMAGKIIV
jgi:ferrous iron transport protein A